MARATSFGSKNIIPSYCWKSRCVLFSMEGLCRHWWSGLSLVDLFFSLLSPENYSLTLFVVGISTLVLILFISNIYSLSFCRNFIFFNFVLQSQFIKYYNFQFSSYSFNFYFFSWTFWKSCYSFHFHPSIKTLFLIFYVILDPYSFYFFWVL